MKKPLIAMAVAIAIIASIAFFMITQGGANAQGDAYAPGGAPAIAANNTTAANAAVPKDAKTPFSSQGYSISMSMAKYEFFEGDDTAVAINVTSPVSTPAEIKYFGFKSIAGRWVSRDSFDADLVQGSNSLILNVTMPGCSGCSGLEEGVQYVNAAVYVNDILVANASAAVMFRKRGEGTATLRND